MLNLDKIRKEIHKKQMLEGTSMSDESLVVAMHLENKFQVPWSNAYPQVSQGNHDNGIDGWFYEANTKILHIYQSKLSINRNVVREGLDDLIRAAEWLAECLIAKRFTKIPRNNVLITLNQGSTSFCKEVETISLILLSPYEDEEELSENFKAVDFDCFRKKLGSHQLNNDFKIEFDVETYILQSKKISKKAKKYPVKQFEDSVLKYKSGTLKIAYLPLEQLVQLYRTHGPELFHKNIRLSVWDLKKNAPKKVANPMREVLTKIVEGTESPAIFSFYHSGVTLFAEDAEFQKDAINLEKPSIINGCQTTTIAADFYNELLKKAELENNREQLERFGLINVIAKIIIGVDSQDLREITNNNNRTNPIEPWQLYSNESIHFTIESLLRERKIFYSRQAGLYNETMKNSDENSHYAQNSKTDLTIKMLGQVQAIYHKHYNYASHPETIFDSKDAHNKIFSENILKEVDEFVFRVNMHKAVKSLIKGFIDEMAEGPAKSQYLNLFGGKGNQRFVYAMEHVLMKIGEQKIDGEVREKTSMTLFKNPSKDLLNAYREFFSPIIKFSKTWYNENTGDRDKSELTKSYLEKFISEALKKYSR